MKWLTIISEIFSILSALLALIAVINTHRINKKLTQERQRLDKRIKVMLQYGSESLELPMELRREEVSRAEILGRLGMIPMKVPLKEEKQPRFSLKYTNKPEFLQQINDIKLSNGEHILTIPCSEDEFKQFDIEKNSI
jgi:hypothetical protein